VRVGYLIFPIFISSRLLTFVAGCASDSALGKSISIDFRDGEVDSFTSSGSPTYGSDGVSFTVAKSGDAPQLSSKFYIMFGKVEITMKAAPGAGIVSTLVLESDDLDEIDLEWLGADSTQVQTNYFGKGDVTTYNRGTYEPNEGNQDDFITYTVEYTAEQIVWSVGGTVVRVLTPATADSNQYPQTPMQVKFGCWSAGDSSNAAGTISWARGPTDYSDGPFTMTVQSIAISDYSTGTSYSYSGTSGDWTDIVANGGEVNGNLPASATTIATAASPAITSNSPSIPAGWPWVATATLSTSSTPVVTYAGVPSGWTVSDTGKLIPVSAAGVREPPPFTLAVAWSS
jgi:beta-glucanase (GH16 family)